VYLGDQKYRSRRKRNKTEITRSKAGRSVLESSLLLNPSTRETSSRRVFSPLCSSEVTVNPSDPATRQIVEQVRRYSLLKGTSNTFGNAASRILVGVGAV
jgi:hypothetical protein